MERKSYNPTLDKRSVVLANYDVKTISEYLSAKLQINIGPESISKPMPDIMYLVFFNFLKKYLEMSEFSMTTLPLSVDIDVDNETHRKSIPTVIIYVTMKSFLDDIGDGKLGLTMCDIVQPAKNPQRIKKILSCLVDFMKFYEVSHPIFERVSDEFSEKREEMESLQIELGQVENKRNQLSAQQSARKRRELELSNELQKLREEFDEIVKSYETINTNKAEALKTKDEILINTQRIVREIETGKKKLEMLKEEILESPDEVKIEIENRRKLLRDIEEDLVTIKEVIAKQRIGIELRVKAEKQIDLMSEKAKNLASEKNEVMLFMNAVMEDEQKMKELENELKFIKEKRIAAECISRETAGTHDKTKKEHIERKNWLLKTVADIERKMEEMRQNQPKCTLEIKEKNEELVAIRNRVSDFTRKLNQEMEDVFKKFRIACDIYETQRKSATERSVAVDRALSELNTTCEKSPTSEYTFSIPEDYYIDENDENNQSRIFK